MIPKKYLLSITLFAANISLFSSQQPKNTELENKIFSSLKLLVCSSNSESQCLATHFAVENITRTLLSKFYSPIKRESDLTFDELTKKKPPLANHEETSYQGETFYQYDPYKLAVIFALTGQSQEPTNVTTFFEASLNSTITSATRDTASKMTAGIKDAIERRIDQNDVRAVTDNIHMMAMSNAASDTIDSLREQKETVTTTLPNGNQEIRETVTKAEISMTEAYDQVCDGKGIFYDQYKSILETENLTPMDHVAYLFALSAHCKTPEDFSSLLLLGKTHPNKEVVSPLLHALIGAFWGKKASDTIESTQCDSQILYIAKELLRSQLPNYKFNEETYNTNTLLAKKDDAVDTRSDKPSSLFSWRNISLFTAGSLAAFLIYCLCTRK